jgi:CHAT domain-containing protein
VHQHIETIKKSALYSVLSSKRFNEGDSITHIIFAENQLYSLYEKKNLKLLLLNSETKKNDSVALALRSELFNISRSLDSIYSIYKTKFPTYAELRFGDKSVTLNDLKASLNADEAVLNYFSTNNSIFVFVVTAKEQQFIKLSANLSLSDSIQLYNKSLRQFSFSEANRLNRYLYEVLIDPIYDFIKSCKNLVIIPDESLSILPFETLSKTPITDLDYSKGNYIIRDFSISYHYNATLWNLGLNSTESSYTKEFAGFAPVFKGNSQTLAELEDYLMNNPKDEDLIFRSGDKFYVIELPFSGEEIEGIGNLFEKSGFTADKFLNLNASESAFKSASSSYRYLHIATHGLVNYDFPQLSGLIFAQNHSSDIEDDGILYAGEISNLVLKTNLVVLSSCESGIGKLIKGEGMLSMSRFFYCAGVPNIMFSLWKVPDNSTNKLMIEFYTNLLENNSKPNALRNAKLKLIENPEYSFPQFWGGFVLLGN